MGRREGESRVLEIGRETNLIGQRGSQKFLKRLVMRSRFSYIQGWGEKHLFSIEDNLAVASTYWRQSP